MCEFGDCHLIAVPVNRTSHRYHPGIVRPGLCVARHLNKGGLVCDGGQDRNNFCIRYKDAGVRKRRGYGQKVFALDNGLITISLMPASRAIVTLF